MSTRQQLVVLLGACACASRQPAPVKVDPAPNSIVAEVYGEKIRAGELDSAVADDLHKLDQELVQKRYEARRQGLDAILFRKLVEHEAALAKIDGETFLRQEVEGKLPKPDERDVRAFYEEN